MDHNAYQRAYFARPDAKPRMAPGLTPYVRRHLEAALAALALPPGARVLELGCGMGRFTGPLAERGFDVTGVDLSPELLEVARAGDATGRIRYLCADSGAVAARVDGPFDGVVGFFFLHHLSDLGPTLAGAARLLAPRGRVAFCEPNAWNPLFYLQILLTPGMSFRGDGGVARMRPGVVAPAWRAAGLGRLEVERYGFFPPALANRPAGARWERRLERLRPLAPVLPFQVFSGGREPADGGAAGRAS